MIYVHIPFCRSFCSYCNFYSTTNTREIPVILASIQREWEREQNSWIAIWRSGQFPLRHTIYLGGGTPSVCSVRQLHPLLDMLTSDMKKAEMEPSEVTVEVNPGDITTDYCTALLDFGVNRLSIGIQSFDDDHLKAMRRRHTGHTAIRSFQDARMAGFRNISIDLLFGFPGLSISKWEETLYQTINLGPEHISAYQLSLEPSSPWGRKGILPPQEECARQYALLQAILQKAGYIQYEVSSFSLPGRESQHNSGYWLRIPYLGLGPAAHSFDGRNRYANVAHLERYIEGIRNDKPVRTYDRLKARDVHNEYIMLQLRTVQGLSLSRIEEHEGPLAVEHLLKRTAPLLERGLLIKKNDRIYIPADHLFISDNIIRNCLLPPR